MTEREEFEEILDVFASIGWKLIQKDLRELEKAIDNIADVDSEKELFKRKGELERLRWFINLKEWYQFSMEMTLEDV